MSTLRVDNLETSTGNDHLDSLPAGARAWVNFDAKNTISIRNSHNVSSITDNGTGDYTVNLTTAMANANGVPVISATPAINSQHCHAFLGSPGTDDESALVSSSAVRFAVHRNDSSPSRADPKVVAFALFGDA